MQPCDNILKAIGRTPLVRLNRITRGLPVKLFVKAEFLNPGGSIKDRIGLAMIEQAEREGRLRPGQTIIEATAGNTGVGLAQAAAVKGYRCIFVLPDKMAQEKISLLKAYGAEIVITPTSVAPDSPESYNGVADRLAREFPDAFRPNQFGNQHNPDAHYRTTGPEIWEDTGGQLDALVAGVGTGGTISGIGKYLKERKPAIRVVVADPEGSILSGDSPKPYKVEGIGEDYIPATFDRQVVDDFVRVSDQESFSMARRLAREEGLLVGGSGGTAVAAALRYAQRLPPGATVVAILPDTGRNYLSKLYSDDWMEANGFVQQKTSCVSVGVLLRMKRDLVLQSATPWLTGTPPRKRDTVAVVSVSPEEPASAAWNLMRKEGFSQLPVLDAGVQVGSLNEIALVRWFQEHPNDKGARVAKLMGQPLPELDISADQAEATRLLLSGHSGILVTENKAPAGILTRSDLVDYWTRRQWSDGGGI